MGSCLGGETAGAEKPGEDFSVVADWVESLVAVDLEDFAGGVDFDLALATIGGAAEFIDFAAVIGVGVIRQQGKSWQAGLGCGKDIGWNSAGFRAGNRGTAGFGIRGSLLRGSAGGKRGDGGDEEQVF